MSSQMPPQGPPPGAGMGQPPGMPPGGLPPEVMQEIMRRAQSGDPQAIAMIQSLQGGGGSPPPPMDPGAQMSPQQVPGMVQGLRGG